MTPDEQAQLFTNIRKADRVAYGLSMGALEGQQGCGAAGRREAVNEDSGTGTAPQARQQGEQPWLG
jgi:hypothetical protein